ncbi:MAG: hypothetical protein POELPBGB_03697 [Bacteroidia bacterium]|nr:hypothetical protein [Bacteroidia bacterium]
MNIEFNYMYRDGANYKQFGSVVFVNPDNISVAEIEMQIKELLIDGEFFDYKKWSIPSIHKYPYDSEIDHDWYTFEGLLTTENSANDKRTVRDFLKEINNKLAYLPC